MNAIPGTMAPLEYLDGRITVHPDICNGRPTIRGMRITVETVLGFLSAGDSPQEILHQYPSLEPADIDVCLRLPGAQAPAWPLLSLKLCFVAGPRRGETPTSARPLGGAHGEVCVVAPVWPQEAELPERTYRSGASVRGQPTGPLALGL